MTDEIPLVYRIDPLDDIVFVNDEWIRFADANDGANLSPEKILNCGLWDFITDETTRQLYRQIVDRVRSGYATRFSLRCDAPACRRVIEMSVASRSRCYRPPHGAPGTCFAFAVGVIASMSMAIGWKSKRPLNSSDSSRAAICRN